MNFRTLSQLSRAPLYSPDEPAAAPAAEPAADAADTSLLGAAEAPAAPAAEPAKPAAADDKTGSAADALKPAEEVKPADEAKPAEEPKDDKDKAAEEEPKPVDNSGDKLKMDELKPPEGFTALDAEAVTAAEPVLRELGLDTAQAQKVMDLAGAVIPKMMERAAAASQEQFTTMIAETRAGWAKSAEADPEIGGSPEKLSASLAMAAKFRDQFGSPELRKLFNETGIGNHPALIRLFAKAGEAIGEGAFHRSDASAQEKPKELHEKLYGDEYQPKGQQQA